MNNGTSGGCGTDSCGCLRQSNVVTNPINVANAKLISGSNTRIADDEGKQSLSPSVSAHGGSIASVNGVPIHALSERLDEDTLRQRAYAELLRQEAIDAGLLSPDDPATDDGVQSEAASSAIETLLEESIVIPIPDETTCRRYFEANGRKFQGDESVQLRHILFAVTPGVDVTRLRQRAEAALLDARCHDNAAEDKFEGLAKQLSNCPTGASGGYLGWLRREDCVPEFARDVFGQSEVGVLPRLIHSRFGLHVVQVLARRQGDAPSFENVRGIVLQTLQQRSYVTALRQYLQVIAMKANIQGIKIDEAGSPLVQ